MAAPHCQTLLWSRHPNLHPAARPPFGLGTLTSLQMMCWHGPLPAGSASSPPVLPLLFIPPPREDSAAPITSPPCLKPFACPDHYWSCLLVHAELALRKASPLILCPPAVLQQHSSPNIPHSPTLSFHFFPPYLK